MEFPELANLTLRMNTYESHTWDKVIEWEQENKGTLWDYCTTASTKGIKKAIESSGTVIPESISKSIRSSLDKGIKACFSGSMYTLDKSKIVARANVLFQKDFKDIDEFEELTLEQLDKLAEEYSTTNQILSLLEGAGMGLGGLLFIAADIPALITINLRLLVQMAYIYGIDESGISEREFILNIMMLASADEKDRQGIFWKLDQQAKNSVQAAILGVQLPEHIIEEVMRKMVGTAHRIALKLTHAKLLQLLPLVGIAIGAGGNYAFSREITTYGMMVMRKRWLMKKYNLFDSVIRYREMKNEKLMTSWVLLPREGEDDDIEYEEDFKQSLSSQLKINNNNNNNNSNLYPSLQGFSCVPDG